MAGSRPPGRNWAPPSLASPTSLGINTSVPSSSIQSPGSDAPTAPPGHWQAADPAMEERQREITGSIAAQVTRMLAEARSDTEVKVKQELAAMRETLTVLDQSLDLALARLEQLDEEEPASRACATVEDIERELHRVSSETEYELAQLKKELHETILAHNHNADFIKTHKETIDSLRARADKLVMSSKSKGGSDKTPDIKDQLAKLAALPKFLPQDDRVEPLLKRVAALEQQVKKVQKSRPGGAAAAGHNPSPGTGYPGAATAAAAAATAAATSRWAAYSGLTGPGVGGMGGNLYSMMSHMGMGGMGGGPPGYMGPGPMAGGKGGGKRNGQQAAAMNAYAAAAQRDKAMAQYLSQMDPYGLHGMGGGSTGMA